MKESDIIKAFLPVKKVFEQLGIVYSIGGSVASSAYGMARATMDIDCVSTLSLDKVNEFITPLQDEYYVDKDCVVKAVQNASSFNLIHNETMLKVDVFIAKQDAFQQMALSRRKEDSLDEEGEIKFYVLSPEDIILTKLDWYNKGGRVSEKQWGDILGVLKVQRELLDIQYLKKWALELDVVDILEQALNEKSL